MKTEAIRRLLGKFHAPHREDGDYGAGVMFDEWNAAIDELAAIREEVEALELTVEYLSSDIRAGTELVKLRNEEIARKDMALDDVRLSLGQSFDSMEKRDLLAIIGEAERIIEAALSGEPSGKVLVDRERLSALRSLVVRVRDVEENGAQGLVLAEIDALERADNWLATLLKEGDDED